MKLKYAWCVFLLAAATLSIDHPKVSSVEGLVTLNGQTPIANATIGLENGARGTHLRRKTDPSGHYLFEEVMPGPYTVWAEARGYGCILIPRLIVEHNQRVRQDFTFSRGTINRECEPLEHNNPK